MKIDYTQLKSDMLYLNMAELVEIAAKLGLSTKRKNQVYQILNFSEKIYDK